MLVTTGQMMEKYSGKTDEFHHLSWKLLLKPGVFPLVHNLPENLRKH